jgi:hypothetical protein
MFNKIDTMLEERFASDESGLRPYDDNGVYIATAIEELFEAEGFEKGDYSVESDVVFSSPAVDVAYVSVAFIVFGKLYHTVYVID